MHRFPHWNHFLVLEADLAAASRYVEFSEDNLKCYSAEFTKILLAAGSEADVVAKAICREIDPSRKYENMDSYRVSIVKRYPRLHTIEVSIPEYGVCFKPWEAWVQDQNPTWWRAYNDVKHHRESCFKQGNLENALLCMAGLYALVLYQLSPIRPRFAELGRMPQLMSTPEGPGPVYAGRFSLPDNEP